MVGIIPLPGTSASRSLFSTPLSAFVSGLRRKRKQSPVSSEPESQRRHIALEPSTHGKCLGRGFWNNENSRVGLRLQNKSLLLCKRAVGCC